MTWPPPVVVFTRDEHPQDYLLALVPSRSGKRKHISLEELVRFRRRERWRELREAKREPKE